MPGSLGLRAIAKKAEQEGLLNVARLFRTAAEAERIHAESHLNSLAGVAATADNLRSAIEGETYEYTQMYPPMVERATAASHRAKTMFGFAMKAEAVRAKPYQATLEAVAQGKDLAQERFYLCPFCGNIEFGVPTERCPICGAPAAKFVEVA